MLMLHSVLVCTPLNPAQQVSDSLLGSVRWAGQALTSHDHVSDVHTLGVITDTLRCHAKHR